MKIIWTLKEYVFAAFMTLGMVLSFTVGYFVPTFPPGLQVVVWSPVAGIFLTIGMARLRYSGCVSLTIAPLAVIGSIINLAIGAFLITPALLTDLIVLPFGGYRGTSKRLIANAFFFVCCTMGGTLLAAYAPFVREELRERFLEFLNTQLR